MRTTLTIDNDLAVLIEQEQRRSLLSYENQMEAKAFSVSALVDEFINFGVTLLSK